MWKALVQSKSLLFLNFISTKKFWAHLVQIAINACANFCQKYPLGNCAAVKISEETLYWGMVPVEVFMVSYCHNLLFLLGLHFVKYLNRFFQLRNFSSQFAHFIPVMAEWVPAVVYLPPFIRLSELTLRCFQQKILHEQKKTAIQ